MFATCIHCCSPLGRNEEVSVFPVGRRLAFDVAKGRLWVICPSCDRWNLSPLEERWEAIEAAESLYRGSRRRAATGEIGLARQATGLELIRIGKPVRQEMVAWRYGRQLRKRFRHARFQRAVDWMDDHGFVEDAESLTKGGLLSGIPVLAVLGLPVLAAKAIRDAETNRVKIRGVEIGGKALEVYGHQLRRAQLTHHREERWELLLPHELGFARATGNDVLPVLRRVLPYLNPAGATERQLGHAQARIEHFGSVERLLDFLTTSTTFQKNGMIDPYCDGQRLALEMMVHEDVERRAVEGELAVLYNAWQDAERIAAIADNLLLPASILDRIKKRMLEQR